MWPEISRLETVTDVPGFNVGFTALHLELEFEPSSARVLRQ